MKKVLCLTTVVLMLAGICVHGAEIGHGNKIYMTTNSGETYAMGYNNVYFGETEETFIVEKVEVSEGDTEQYILQENTLYQYDYDKGEYYKKLDNVKEYIPGYALTYTNELYAWGNKLFMGIGATETEYVTEPIKIMDEVKKLCNSTAGKFVIKTDGSLWAWGLDGTMTTPPDHRSSMAITYNKLGAGKTAETVRFDNYFTVVINAQKILDNVKEVYTTLYVSFAVTETGELYGWGMKKWNNLLSTSPDESTPQLLLDNVYRFETAGNFTALATRNDGSLWAWGEGFGNKPEEILKNVAYVVKGSEYSNDFTFALCRNRDLYAIGNFAQKLMGNKSYTYKVSINIKSILPGSSTTMLCVTENNELCVVYKSEGVLKKLADIPQDIIWAKAYTRYNFDSSRPFILYVDKDNNLWHKDLTEGGESKGKILSDVKVEKRENYQFPNIAVYYGLYSIDTDVAPYIKDDRTLVPMRAIFETLGAKVSWDDETKTAIAIKGDTEIKINIGENALYKNGERIELDCAAEITNDRTMVPVRAISEAFGCTVTWDDEMKAVKIITDEDLTKIYYTYDKEGKLIYRKEKSGTWVYTYDEKGNVIRVDGPEIGYNEYAYDENNNLILYKSYDGYVFEYQYDENGNKTVERLSHYRTGMQKWSQTKTWTYNEKGQCVSAASEPSIVTTYTYDDNGNLSKETGHDGGWKEYTYDENNNLIYWEDNNGNWEKYTYDENGNMVRREESDGTVIVYTYDENNNKTRADFTHGKYAGHYFKYEYDDNGNLVYSENN